MFGSSLDSSLRSASTSSAQYRKYLLALFGGERPALRNTVAHRVLALRCDAAQAEILQGPDQTLVLARDAFAVDLAFELGTEVQNIAGQRPPERQVTSHLGVRDKTDDQRVSSDVVGRMVGQLIAPQPGVCPVPKSWNTAQTTSGRSPGIATNSKSSRMMRANGRLFPVPITARPFLHEDMIGAIDQPAAVAKRHAEEFRGLDLGQVGSPNRLAGAGKLL